MVHNTAPFLCVSRLEATSAWQWFRFLHAQVPSGSTSLILNLDETSIRFFYQPKAGMRFRKTQSGPKGVHHTRHASRSQLRKALTHIAVICNDTAIQPLIPQICLVAAAAVPKRDLAHWKPLKGSSAEVWRSKSAWINVPMFVLVVRRLGSRLREVAPGRQLILLMDAHSVHTAAPVLAEARRQNIWICIIPASTTSLLQPLDTDVFARFKRFLQSRLQEMMGSGSNTDMKITDILNALQAGLRSVLQKHAWAEIFEKNGFGSRFFVRPRLLSDLDWVNQPTVTDQLPSLQQFGLCFRRGADIPFDQLLLAVAGHRETRTRWARKRAVERGVPEVQESWSDRLRPRLKAKTTPPVESTDAADPTTPAMRAVVEAPLIPMAPVRHFVDDVPLRTLRPFPPRRRRPPSGLPPPT